MSATAPQLDLSVESTDREAVTQLAEQLRDHLNLLDTLLEDSAKDPDVRLAATHLVSDARHLWAATSKLAASVDIHSTADLEARVDAGIQALEPILVGLETFKETAPEVLDDLSRSGTLQDLATATVEWIEVMGQARRLLTGSSPSLAARMQTLLTDIERWAEQLLVAWETLAATMPEVMDSETFRGSLLKLTNSFQVWTSVAHEARTLLGHCGGGDPAAAAHEIICAIRDAQQDMQGKAEKRGGMFALISLVLSGKTLYVLRYAITVAYRVLKTIDRPAKAG